MVMRRRWFALPLVALLLSQSPYVAFAGQVASMSPLQNAGNWATKYTYTLHSLTSCEVGDGLSVVENVGDLPLRLRSLSVLYEGGAGSYAAHTTYQLVSFRRATTEGQLGATFDLAVLANGRVVGPATGGVLDPVKPSGLWYVIVARIKVAAFHRSKWGIAGLRVGYRVGTTAHSVVLRQSVELPPVDDCA